MGGLDQSIVLDIYDTVLDGSRWPDVLDRIAQAVGARGCIIFELDEIAPGERRLIAPHISGNYDRKAVDAYAERFSAFELADQDIFARYSAAADRIDLIGDHVLAANAEELAARPNSAAMADFGIYHRAGALLSKDNPARDRFSIQFSERHGPMLPDEKKLLDQLLPHVAKAFELARPIAQLQRQRQSLTEALNRFRIGVCLIRANRQIVSENAEFVRQRETARVFRRSPQGLLEMLSPADQAWFQKMVEDCTGHGQFGARPRKEALGGQRADCGKLAVEVAPLTSADAFGERRLDGFVIYSLDTSKPIDLDVEIVSRVLSLTESEAALVGMMAEGLTNREISERRNRSVETVNSQVKSLLSKADCANRTQFIRLATNIGANFLNR